MKTNPWSIPAEITRYILTQVLIGFFFKLSCSIFFLHSYRFADGTLLNVVDYDAFNHQIIPSSRESKSKPHPQQPSQKVQNLIYVYGKSNSFCLFIYLG